MTDSRNDRSVLNGVGVLITRPAHQAGALSHLITRAGGTVVQFPTVEILPPADPQALVALLDRLADFDLAIFISPNAVEQTFAHLRSRHIEWPTTLAVAAVGQGSVRRLEQAGIEGVIVPRHRFDSETLLAEPALAKMTGKRVVIFRGEGGRPVLGDTLRHRGADVVYAEAYRRERPKGDTRTLIDAWRHDRIQIISITSTDGLDNLYAMIDEGHRSRLLQTPVVVLSQRQAERCRALGFIHDALLAPTASDEAILETIKTWRRERFSL